MWKKQLFKYSNQLCALQIPTVGTVHPLHSPYCFSKWLLVNPFVSRGKIENYFFPIIHFYLLKWINWIFMGVSLMVFRNGICNRTRFLKFSRPLYFLNETDNVSINRIFLFSLIIIIHWKKMEIQLSSKYCALFHLSWLDFLSELSENTSFGLYFLFDGLSWHFICRGTEMNWMPTTILF